ncbi:hypothetical protein CEXT_529391 [Caerostris extrusa]|uniref:Uncharacterized protein n=1 Tax=Caerostris extrusa TaxID=172846 RepID=A0AAV4RH17_CAEEX|nr:hypothetical protein CEXT_529391 [Caerostris extrusa]
MGSLLYDLNMITNANANATEGKDTLETQKSACKCTRGGGVSVAGVGLFVYQSPQPRLTSCCQPTAAVAREAAHPKMYKRPVPECLLSIIILQPQRKSQISFNGPKKCTAEVYLGPDVRQSGWWSKTTDH